MTTTKDHTIPRTGGVVHIRESEPNKEKYRRLLNLILPWKSIPKEGRILPVETPGSGCCQYLSVHWMNSVMVKAYRNGLSSKDLYELSGRDEGHFNAERFQRIWEEEVRESQSGKNGIRNPSLAKCVWKFARTRLILSSILIMFSIVLQFVG